MNLLRWFGLFGVLLVTVIFRMPARGDQSITLAWNRDTETNIFNYNLYYGGGSGAPINSPHAVHASKFTVAPPPSPLTSDFSATRTPTACLGSARPTQIIPTLPPPRGAYRPA